MLPNLLYDLQMQVTPLDSPGGLQDATHSQSLSESHSEARRPVTWDNSRPSAASGDSRQH